MEVEAKPETEYEYGREAGIKETEKHIAEELKKHLNKYVKKNQEIEDKDANMFTGQLDAITYACDVIDEVCNQKQKGD